MPRSETFKEKSTLIPSRSLDEMFFVSTLGRNRVSRMIDFSC